MPYESRKIALSAEELLRAVQIFRRDHPAELPHGDLVDARIEDGHIDISMRTGPHGQDRRNVTLPPSLAVRTLVNFCLDEKIPLPRHAHKTFCIEDGRATLLIDLVTGRAARSEEMAAEYARQHEDPRQALEDCMVRIMMETDELRPEEERAEAAATR